jgi:molecular chaperone GrpE
MANGEDNGQVVPEEETSSQEKPAQPSEQEDAASHQRPPKQIMITDIELKNLKKEASEYKDKYLRLLADVENTRKRMQKERQEMTNYAIENIIVDFLRPMDNLENALKFAEQMSDEVKNWAVGFQMILTQFKDVLTENGIVPMDSKETLFDPHLHEAVEMVETEKFPAGTIVEECVRGYKRGDRTIRPARVKVAKATSSSQPQEKQDQLNNEGVSL